MEAVQNHSSKVDYSAKNSVKPVNFYCAGSQAQKVEIAGDFNNWHPLPMQRLLDGWWFVRLELCHGHHQYRFIVDGKPQLDPHAMGSALDEKDERVSLVAVG
jgi:1,4-alpha-glucan branching enzyme